MNSSSNISLFFMLKWISYYSHHPGVYYTLPHGALVSSFLEKIFSVCSATFCKGAKAPLSEAVTSSLLAVVKSDRRWVRRRRKIALATAERLTKRSPWYRTGRLSSASCTTHTVFFCCAAIISFYRTRKSITLCLGPCHLNYYTKATSLFHRLSYRFFK
jgi:hypothetical protein